MIGPGNAFEGRNGLWENVAPRNFNGL